MIAEPNGGLKIDLFCREGALEIQNGFPCGKWNDQSRGILQLRPFNITTLGQIDLGAAKFVETDRNVDAYRLQNRDVIFNNTNSEELVGKVAIWTNGQSAVLSNHMTILRVLREDRLSPEFLSFYLLKRWFDGYFHAICRRHVNQASVSVERLRNTDFPEFDVAEQRKIAAVLGLVQQAIEQQERLIALTTELKKALLHKLFTEGLRGEPQKQAEIGPVPESWEVVMLGSLAKIGNGSTPKRNNSRYWREGTMPWLNSTKIHDLFITEADQYVTALAIKECHLPRVKPGSVLIAITGQGKTLGNSALVRFETCINQHLAYAQFFSPSVVPEFLLWFMQTRYQHLRAVSQAGGSTKGALTCGYLKTYPVPLPSLDEQREIADAFAVLVSKEKLLNRKRSELIALFRSLLHQLMTAQIRLNNLDENVILIVADSEAGSCST
jgi:type I restriction enzyme S subunit